MINNKILIFILSITLFSCSSIEELPIVEAITQPDYVSSKKAKKLESPPDLDELSSSEGYSISGEPTSLKKYLNKDENKNLKNIIEDNKIKVVKSGNMRWLVVPANQKIVWPLVESFWEDMGFNINSAKKSGFIETEWISDADLRKDDTSSAKLDRWLDALTATASKRKFRTRIEDGTEDGTTEIYLSQRSLNKGLDEHYDRKATHYQNTTNPDTVYKIQKYKSDDEVEKNEIVSNFKEDDIEIQIELLRRLMVRLGSSDLSAKEKIDNASEIKRAELINSEDHKYILLTDTYGRSWRRLSLALDMVGFLVEDKDRSDGIFYIKYSNLEIDESKPKKKKGIISKLAFWSDDDIDIEEDPEGQEKYRQELDGDQQAEDSETNDKKWTDKTWEEKFPFFANWGDDNEQDVPEGEKRFRVRIIEADVGSKVYIDYPDETINNTRTAQSIVNKLYDYLKS
jgi:outer membrane protein assembly factor BamC